MAASKDFLVIGCDPSTKKIALVWTLNNDTGSAGSWVYELPETQDYAERCASAFQGVEGKLWELADDYPDADIYFFIEGPVVGRGGAYATISQAKVHGAIVAACSSSQVVEKTFEVNNSTAKKQVIGKGNAGKPEIRQWASVYWRVAYDEAVTYAKKHQQDVLDAAMINRYGHHVIGVKQRLTTFRKKKTRSLRSVK